MNFTPRILLFFGLLFLLMGVQAKGQDPVKYDSIFRKIYLETSQKDYPKAKKLADSLYLASTTPLFKTKSLMLSASLCQQGGEIKEAIEYASKAEEYLQGTQDWDWKARVYGFLATQFRYLKLFHQSEKYIEKTLDLTQKIKDPLKKNNLLGFVYQEKAYHALETKDYQQSISHIETTKKHFEASEVQDPQLIATNFQLLGLNYYYLKDFPKSYSHYFQALETLGSMQNTYLYSLVNNGIANLYLDEDKVEESKPYLDEAYRISEKSTYLTLNIEVLITLEKYYLKVRDYKKLNETQTQRDLISSQWRENAYAFVDQAYSGLENSKVETDKLSKNRELLIYAVSLIFLISMVYFIIYRRQKRKEYLEIQEALQELELKLSKNEFSAPHLDQPSRMDESTEELIRLMPKETEEILLEKLTDFEKSKFYLKKNISLSDLASKFDTNTKYLSYVINTHKGKEFKNYIKELRIIYILRKMEENPQYRLYKIAALSEETGFSSPSKFASAFKNVTKVTPSVYVQHLKDKSGKIASNPQKISTL